VVEGKEGPLDRKETSPLLTPQNEKKKLERKQGAKEAKPKFLRQKEKERVEQS